jgi:hypothetical protein
MTLRSVCHQIAGCMLAFSTLSPALPAWSEIASPVNAGQGAGNNASASSNVPFSLFSGQQEESLVQGCSGYGVSGFQGCSQESIDYLNRSFQTTLSSIDASEAPSLVLQVLSAPDPIDSALLDIGSQSSSNQFTNTQRRFNTKSVPVALPTVASQSGASNLFAMQSIRLGLYPSSVKLGLELVELGVPIQPALRLVSALQGLATNPTYNALSNGIKAFNEVVKASPDTVRNQLDANTDFIEVSNALRSVRTAVVVR